MYFPPQNNFIDNGGKPMPPPHHMGFIPPPFDFTLTPPPHHHMGFFPPPHFQHPIGLPQHPSFDGFPNSSFSILSNSTGISSSGFMSNNGNNNSNMNNINNSGNIQSPQQQQKPTTSTPTLAEIFDDLSSRFVINIPQEELETFERLLFQIEAAHWFYDDFYREEHLELPKFNLSEFTKVFFNHCPLLQPHQNSVEEICKKFSEYKTRVPVFGCIILNENLDKALFVKGFGSCTWGFPKGKVNKDEPDHDCAIREVYEETGFDCTAYLNQRHFIEVFIKEQKTKLYIVAGVPEETVFKTRTRKEISKIEWIAIDDLPSLPTKNKQFPNQQVTGSNATINPNSGYKDKNFYRAFPFFQKLKRWIANRKSKYPKEGYATSPFNEGNNTTQNNNTTNTNINNIQNQSQNQTPKNNSNPNVNSNTGNNSNQNSLNKINYSPYPMSPPISPRDTKPQKQPTTPSTPTVILRNPNSLLNNDPNATNINSNNSKNNNIELTGNLTSVFTNQMKQFGIQVEEPIQEIDYPTLSDEFNNFIFKMNSFDVNDLSNCFARQ